MSAKKELAEVALKRAEAVARETGIDIELKVLYARNIADCILDEITVGKFDLLVLGTINKRHDFKHKGMGALAEKILKKAPCRVWVCATKK